MLSNFTPLETPSSLPQCNNHASQSPQNPPLAQMAIPASHPFLLKPHAKMARRLYTDFPSLTLSRDIHLSLLRYLSYPTLTSRPSLVAPHTNETLGFQKIFTLNLPSRTDRQDSLVLAAARTGLDLEFVDGLRGEDVDEVAFPIVCGKCCFSLL